MVILEVWPGNLSVQRQRTMSYYLETGAEGWENQLEHVMQWNQKKMENYRPVEERGLNKCYII